MAGKDNLRSTYAQKLIILVLAISLLGCKSLQKISTVFDEHASTPVIVEKTLLASPQSRSVDIKKMNVRLNLNNQNQYNSPANCKIIVDSAIYISVQPLFGIEMFVAKFTPDEILFIDKTKSTYYQSDYIFLNQKFNLELNYDLIQSVLMNKLFVVGETKVHPSLFKKTKEKQVVLELNYENAKYTEKIVLRPDFRISDVAVTSKGGTEEFKVGYADFKTTEKLTIFPYSIKLNIKTTSNTFGLDMIISKMGVDETITLPALNLSNYRQGNISSLLK